MKRKQQLRTIRADHLYWVIKVAEEMAYFGIAYTAARRLVWYEGKPRDVHLVDVDPDVYGKCTLALDTNPEKPERGTVRPLTLKESIFEFLRIQKLGIIGEIEGFSYGNQEIVGPWIRAAENYLSRRLAKARAN